MASMVVVRSTQCRTHCFGDLTSAAWEVVNDPPQTRVSHVRDYFWLTVTAAKYRSCPFNRACNGCAPRFAARLSGLAYGLALAVRPAGSAVAPALKVGPEDRFCEAVRNDLQVP
jgi:hypothetical protein